MFSWIGIAFTILRYLPTAFSIIREIVKIINGMKGEQKTVARRRFKESLAMSKVNRDTESLNECLRELRKHA